MEAFFGSLEPGINGVYHHFGEHHLRRYLTEFDFRYNSREVSGVDRQGMAIAQTGGKRLKYRDT